MPEGGLYRGPKANGGGALAGEVEGREGGREREMGAVRMRERETRGRMGKGAFRGQSTEEKGREKRRGSEVSGGARGRDRTQSGAKRTRGGCLGRERSVIHPLSGAHPSPSLPLSPRPPLTLLTTTSLSLPSPVGYGLLKVHKGSATDEENIAGVHLRGRETEEGGKGEGLGGMRTARGTTKLPRFCGFCSNAPD